MSHNSTEEEPLGLNISCKNPHNFTRIEVDLQALARRKDVFTKMYITRDADGEIVDAV
jgi:hypothetical protein